MTIWITNYESSSALVRSFVPWCSLCPHAGTFQGLGHNFFRCQSVYLHGRTKQGLCCTATLPVIMMTAYTYSLYYILPSPQDCLQQRINTAHILQGIKNQASPWVSRRVILFILRYSTCQRALLLTTYRLRLSIAAPARSINALWRKVINVKTDRQLFEGHTWLLYFPFHWNETLNKWAHLTRIDTHLARRINLQWFSYLNNECQEREIMLKVWPDRTSPKWYFALSTLPRQLYRRPSSKSVIMNWSKLKLGQF